MSLTSAEIAAAKSDDVLFKLLSDEIERQVPATLLSDIPKFLRQLRTTSPGVRAMAATHQLSVSMALDSLEWHFGNWHSKRLAIETESGLRELGADETAKIFGMAYRLSLPFWKQLGRSNWYGWLENSELEKVIGPLNTKMWKLEESRKYGMMSYWLDYARKHPGRVIQR